MTTMIFYSILVLGTIAIVLAIAAGVFLRIKFNKEIRLEKQIERSYEVVEVVDLNFQEAVFYQNITPQFKKGKSQNQGTTFIKKVTSVLAYEHESCFAR